MRARLAVIAIVIGLLAGASAGPAAAQGFVPISGAGSSWSFNALDQWRRNVASLYGITVQYADTGSSDGRNQFKNGTVDFAVSEIEYGLTDGGVVDQPPSSRGYAYMPIVAGGTAFMYNLHVGRNRVTNLRLSGEVLAKIFTLKITSWADPAIKKDNPGLTLPDRKIVPVVRSDGSGTTAQFTRWMADQYGSVWDSFCGRPKCGFTSNYPIKPGLQAKARSTGVAGYVAQDSSEGAITYVEYSYAKNAAFPVTKVLNRAGYYIEPKATSVAVALLKAEINPDDLTQRLQNVYRDTDPRSYPLSSYSYMILPTDNRQNFSDAKGRTLSEFAYYFLCEGQRQADALGYSPLPLNLVKAGVRQVARVPGTTNKLNENDLQKCNNPTFSPDGTNTLANTAPQPPECDKAGATQCATGTGGAQAATPVGNGGGDTGNGGTTPGGTPGTAGEVAGGTEGAAPASAEVEIDPDTGLPVEESGGTAVNAYAVPVSVDLPQDRTLFAVLAMALLTSLVIGPPLLARALRKRRKS
ncbi:phosphate ABC transporter substrate-binding protein PstS [Actinophytocola sp.]|uniref:phosphate ABC transporter substrate-binding protein PstS n=1 Tax=Actinophytocola sp. TaxID=1872138 RepID=UPI002ECFDCF4